MDLATSEHAAELVVAFFTDRGAQRENMGSKGVTQGYSLVFSDSTLTSIG